MSGVATLVGEAVHKMLAAAQRADRDDMRPAMIVYSPEGFCGLIADPDILTLGHLETPFEDRPFYGCAQEIDPRATVPWRVLSSRAADERHADQEHRRVHGQRSNSGFRSLGT